MAMDDEFFKTFFPPNESEPVSLVNDLNASTWYKNATFLKNAAAPFSISFDFLINGIGITVVASLGIIGNILSGIVLSHPQMKSSVTCLLLGLAFCDTCLISISIFIFGLLSISEFTDGLQSYRYVYYPLLVPYLFPVSITAQTGSVYLTLAVTIERYIAVCHPLRARSICTWRRAVMCVIAVITLSILYNLPRWFEVCTVELAMMAHVSDGNDTTNGTATAYDYAYGIEMCPMRESPGYKLIYINWSYLFVMYLAPFTGLVVGNWAIYRQVRKANRARAAMSKLQKRELGLATMLLFVVSVFLLCNVLPLVNNILESFYDQSIDALVQFSNFLVVLNSSVNFVIYCTCGERFRKLLFRLCNDLLVCRGVGKSDLYRKSGIYRVRRGGGGGGVGGMEEMSMGSVAYNNTCVTTNGRFTSLNGIRVNKCSNANVKKTNNNTGNAILNGNNGAGVGVVGGGVGELKLNNASRNQNVSKGVIIGNGITITTATDCGT